MKKLVVLSLVIGLLTCLVTAGFSDAPRTAVAKLIDKNGKHVGRATFIEQPDGVQVYVEVHGLTPGKHGIHIHNVGKADPPSFASAGGHFNPGHKQHGLDNPEGHHAGDLPNLWVDKNGKGHATFLATGATLGWGPDSLFHEGGTSLVIHAGADDEKTDPTGNSGGRVVCGVIVRE